jgi:dTMP kinase
MSFFVTLEGPEGSGKSTQVRRLAKHLREKGHDVLLSREPGGTSIGDQIREVLTNLDNTAMDPRTEFLLFSSSRAQLVYEVIKPHLARGGIVVCDRFYHSSLAYQGYGHGLDLEPLRVITRFATAGLEPDLVLLLDLPVEDGLRRRRKEGRWNRLDAFDLDFHRCVRKGYLKMAAADHARWATIDAMASPDEVHTEIRRKVEAFLPQTNLNKTGG